MQTEIRSKSIALIVSLSLFLAALVAVTSLAKPALILRPCFQLKLFQMTILTQIQLRITWCP